VPDLVKLQYDTDVSSQTTSKKLDSTESPNLNAPSWADIVKLPATSGKRKVEDVLSSDTGSGPDDSEDSYSGSRKDSLGKTENAVQTSSEVEDQLNGCIDTNLLDTRPRDCNQLHKSNPKLITQNGHNSTSTNKLRNASKTKMEAQEEIFVKRNGHAETSSKERNGDEYSDEDDDEDGDDEDEDEYEDDEDEDDLEKINESELVCSFSMQFPIKDSSKGAAQQTTAPAFAQDGVTILPEAQSHVSEPIHKFAAASDSTSSQTKATASVEKVEPSTEEEIVQEQVVKQELESKADTSLPETVTRLDTQHGSSVYLVGTAHFSKESQEDVALTIRTVKPDIVVVELCKARTAILQLDEETILQESRNLDRGKIMMILRQHGTIQGLLYILLLSVSAHITKELGMAPGGEFRTAFAEARRSAPGCIMQLGDRPIAITLARALASLSLWHKIKLTWHMITSKEPISKEEVERCKQRDFIEEMLAEMTGQFPAISEVFVKERDIYLCRSLQAAAHPIPDPSSPTGVTGRVVVGVVGIGHVPGIVERWGKVTEADIPPIMRNSI
ncbi:unnamed protein product, partial [Meganyctiphanes norvegica]